MITLIKKKLTPTNKIGHRIKKIHTVKFSKGLTPNVLIEFNLNSE